VWSRGVRRRSVLGFSGKACIFLLMWCRWAKNRYYVNDVDFMGHFEDGAAV
jgi:hypothetical protein